LWLYDGDNLAQNQRHYHGMFASPRRQSVSWNETGGRQMTSVRGGIMAFQGDNSIERGGTAAALDDDVGGSWLEFGRRLSDIVAALVGLVLLAPILLITAVAVKLSSRGPIFVRETLHGPDNHPIEVFKFRFAEGSSAGGKRNNPRPTQLGLVLGHTDIDQLPRLVNVLRGELSIVGRQDVKRWPDTAC
jgi:Bacterial sugar transferase